jgi:uncharacterized protein YecE (DUF72 family)
MSALTVATAGWSVPKAVSNAFPAEGPGLARYAARFAGVEINTTFYRSHRPGTYVRWAQTTPTGFQFAVKLPRRITHEARLVDAGDALTRFRAEVEGLGDKLGPLLIQLPPSLVFSAAHDDFFRTLRGLWPDPVVCEPRHPSWFDAEGDALLRHWRIARVAANPSRHPSGGAPGGWTGLAYWRLHGSPRMYWSSYDGAALERLADRLRSSKARQTWCVFDNTASGAAAENALTLATNLVSLPPNASKTA